MSLSLPDANVLIHALRKDSAEHDSCRRWLTSTAATGGAIALCELVEAALLRIPSLPKLQLVPMAETLGFWKDDLWSYPGTRRLAAGNRHTGIFSDFITSLGLCGNDISDVWLAALAIEHRATLVSTDQGFARFPGLSWINPVSPFSVSAFQRFSFNHPPYFTALRAGPKAVSEGSRQIQISISPTRISPSGILRECGSRCENSNPPPRARTGPVRHIPRLP